MSQFEDYEAPKKKLSAEGLVEVLAANVNKSNLSDAAFRELARNTLSLVTGSALAAPSAPYQNGQYGDH